MRYTVGWLVSASLLGLYLKGLHGRWPKEDVDLCRRSTDCLFQQQDFCLTSPTSHLPCCFPLVLIASSGASTVFSLLQASVLQPWEGLSMPYALGFSDSHQYWSSDEWHWLTQTLKPTFLLQKIPVLCQLHWKLPVGVCNYVCNCVLVWILYVSSTMTDALLIIGRISFASSTVNHAHSSSF